MTSMIGKKIWLIGASTGIGEALARQLAAAGASVALSARSEDKIGKLLQELPGGPHLAAVTDVTDQDSINKAWSTIEAAWSDIDIMIYNAGVYEPMSGAQFDLPKIEAMLDVNFQGALRTLGTILPYFFGRRAGHIVLVASAAAYRGLPNAIGYGASKAALLHLAENLRLDLKRCGIKVQVISPGFVKTRLTEKNSFPMPFIITPQEAAQHICEGLTKDHFEINFPKRLTFLLKFLRLLPYNLYFRLLNNM